MNMIMHPGTRILIAFSYIVLIVSLSPKYQAVFVLFGALIALKSEPLSKQDPVRVFIKLWLTAGFFLFIIHCISWKGGLVFNWGELELAIKSFFVIGSLMTAFLWLIRTTKSEELYAMLISFKIPIGVIYVLFRTAFLIPRLGERSNEILLAQQARGFALKGVRNRLKAYILILVPLFSTMFYELEENAAAITSKGLYAPGIKSSLTRVVFTPADVIIIILSSALAVTLLMTVS